MTHLRELTDSELDILFRLRSRSARRSRGCER